MSPEGKQNTSTWLALKNRVFLGLWIASLVSGCCVSAHDTAATWLMNSLGASPFLLSLMATSASMPFFLFTLPAGAISDLVNRQKLFVGTYLWLAAAAGLLAVCTWLHLVHPVYHSWNGVFARESALPLTLLSGLRSFPKLSEKKNSLQRSPWAACR